MKKLFPLTLILAILFSIPAMGAGKFSQSVDNWLMGKASSSSDKVLEADIGASPINPKIRYSLGSSKWQFSHNGITFTDFGGGSGGGGVGIDFLELQGVVEQAGIKSYTLADTLRESYAFTEPANSLWLMDQATAASSSIVAIFNPSFLSSSDKNFDTFTGWVADGAAANVMSNGVTHKLGTAALSFDKTNGAATGGVTIPPAVALSEGSTQVAWFWLNMPSVTNLTSVNVVACSDSGSTNCSTYSVSLNSAGGALGAGWNLIKTDLSIAPTSTTGTPWDPTQLIGALHLTLTTSPSTQTYTGVLIDGLAFSSVDPSLYEQLGDAYTIYDATNAEEIILDVSSPLQGILTLAGSLTNTYSSGSGTSILRSSATSGSGKATFASGNAGAVNLLISSRRKTVLRAPVASVIYNVDVTEKAPLVFKVFSVDSGVQIKIVDPSDNSAQFTIGDKYYVLATYNVNGKKQYVYRQLIETLDQSAANAAGNTTLHSSSSTAGIQVGDTIIKADVDTYTSLVALNANESFGSALTDSDLQVVNTGVNYPYVQNVWANWTLGGGQPQAFQNKQGPGPDLTLTGSLSTVFPFLNGLFATSGFVDPATNYLHASAASTQPISGAAADSSTVNWSIWFNCAPFDGATNQVIFQRLDGGSTGYQFFCQNTSNTITGNLNGNTFTVTTFTPNVMHNFIWQHATSGLADDYWLDGVHVLSNAFGIGSTAIETRLGVSGAGAAIRGGLADPVVWRNAPAFTSADVTQIYQGGFPSLMSDGTLVKHMYVTPAISGQKLSLKVNAKRKTSAVIPAIRQTAVQRQ